MFCLSLQDTFLLLTPGGGGYEQPLYDTPAIIKNPVKNPQTLERGSVYNYRMLQESV